MTKPISFRLAESVIQAIKDRAASEGISQGSYLTRLVMPAGLQSREYMLSGSPDPQPYVEVRARREAVKAEKRGRKANLAAEVSAALPVRTSDAPTYCPFHRPKYCAPECRHRVSL